MLTPAYKVTFGHSVVDTTDKPQASTVVDLEVALDMETPADSFRLVVGEVGGQQPARGDAVTIALGYADDSTLTQVMTATAVSVERGLATTRVVGYSAASALLHGFVENTYLDSTAGTIVSDLASRSQVEVATADDGITFPAYVVDGRRSAYLHIHDLAALSGLELYIDTDGKLVFETFTGGNAVHTFEYAKDILALDALRAPPLAGEVQAWGESPTGSQGADAWSWLTKDFGSSKGTAGTGALFLLERSALRTSTAASIAAQAALTAIQRRTLRGTIVSLGRPEVKLGDAIRLQSMPDASLNQTLQVRSLTHRMSKRRGFTTTIGFRAIQTP